MPLIKDTFEGVKGLAELPLDYYLKAHTQVGTKAIIATISVGTVCLAALVGIEVPDLIMGLALSAGNVYLGYSVAKSGKK